MPGGKAGSEKSKFSKAWKAKDASPSSHEPLGNLANSRRDSHIPTSSGDEGGWKSGKPRSGFPLFHRLESIYHFQAKNTAAGGASPLRLAAGAPRPLRVKSNCRQQGEIVVVNAKK
jgi:hypothetical protein